ncbi:MAG: YkgJ family cysteine cluster protein, partial [Pseudomonadota bacterium]
MAKLRHRFWERVPLTAMSAEEWEALCDGCGKCCVIKLEAHDTGAVQYTDVACRLFDPETCRCGQYALRHQLVEGCVRLSPSTLPDAAQWMP